MARESLYSAAFRAVKQEIVSRVGEHAAATLERACMQLLVCRSIREEGCSEYERDKGAIFASSFTPRAATKRDLSEKGAVT
jgi:hypothetical protein